MLEYQFVFKSYRKKLEEDI